MKDASTTQDIAFLGSRDRVIPEEAFLPLLEEAAAPLLALREEVRQGEGKEWRRRFVSRLLKEIHSLRSVLNDYEANENRTYSFLMELVAGIRGFATVIYTLKHAKERYLRSPLSGTGPHEEEFLAGLGETLAFCGETLRFLFLALINECDEVGMELPATEPGEQANGPTPPAIRMHLPHNLDEEEMTDDGEKVAQVASAFARVAEDYESIAPHRLRNFPELREFVLTRLDEEKARTIETAVHAIQSRYDTYIQYTSIEQQEPDLKRLRSIISISLHLFEVATRLVHFYERHENDIRSARAKERIATIVDKTKVLDRAVNFAFRGVGWLMAEGREIAERLIPKFTNILEVTLRIPAEIRLHLRPASLIAMIVTHHGTPVTMKMGDESCEASSVADVIFLAGTHVDEREVTFRGDRNPIGDLGVLFAVGLRDEGHAAVVERLPYLNRN